MPKYFLAAFWLTMLLARTAAAQSPLRIEDNYTIRGYVIVPSNQYKERFEVLLTSKAGEQIIDRMNVSISNFYTFTGLSSGYYDLVVRLDGYREARLTVHAGFDSILGGVSNYSVSPTDSNLLIPNPIDVNISLEPIDDRANLSKQLMAEYAEGLRQSTLGHPDLAVTNFENVLAEAPDFYDAHFSLAAAYQDLARHSEAEREFRKAHDLNSRSARPLLALGRLFVEEADIEIFSESNPGVIQLKLQQARDSLTQAIALDSRIAAGFYYLGAVDFRMASYTTAEQELKRALELDPSLAAARITLINVAIQQEQWQNALDNADVFLLENPTSPYRQQVAATRSSVVRRLQPAP